MTVKVTYWNGTSKTMAWDASLIDGINRVGTMIKTIVVLRETGRSRG